MILAFAKAYQLLDDCVHLIFYRYIYIYIYIAYNLFRSMITVNKLFHVNRVPNFLVQLLPECPVPVRFWSNYWLESSRRSTFLKSIPQCSPPWCLKRVLNRSLQWICRVTKAFHWSCQIETKLIYVPTKKLVVSVPVGITFLVGNLALNAFTCIWSSLEHFHSHFHPHVHCLKYSLLHSNVHIVLN